MLQGKNNEVDRKFLNKKTIDSRKKCEFESNAVYLSAMPESPINFLGTHSASRTLVKISDTHKPFQHLIHSLVLVSEEKKVWICHSSSSQSARLAPIWTLSGRLIRAEDEKRLIL